MDIYHNILQNKAVQYPDDVVENILSNGFQAEMDNAVWLSDKPLGDGTGCFVGVVVHVPDNADLEPFRVQEDAIEIHMGVRVYAVPAHVVNQFSVEQIYFRQEDLIENWEES